LFFNSISDKKDKRKKMNKNLKYFFYILFILFLTFQRQIPYGNANGNNVPSSGKKEF
jgi:hypothetical protein